ncbi:DUF6537 domain-containing protein, partial [Parasphingorhabdus sp.]|uniref:DUF6537 domain-containing protein n=1 Tax=Parasphingorhabdus sp. TaxID=2709688 RepID=UPI0032ECA6CB
NVTANTLMLGYAWQKGLIPLSLDAMLGAITANGAAVALNMRAFDWGRLAAIDMAKVEEVAKVAAPTPIQDSLTDQINRLQAELISYQDADYAARYSSLMAKAEQAVAELGQKGDDFLRAVATNAYKLMAYKDEYEVARLYALPSFRDNLADQFASTGKLSVWLAPPIISRIDPATGRPKKRKFGVWIFNAFALLAKGKFLRGSALDPFGRTHERKAERALRDQYIETITDLCTELDTVGLDRAIALAQLPDMVRGYGPVKEKAMADYTLRRAELISQGPKMPLSQAA